MNLIRESLELLREHGWIKSWVGPDRVEAPHCIRGALCILQSNGQTSSICMDSSWPEYDIILGVIKSEFPDRKLATHYHSQGEPPMPYVVAFNNHRDTTFDDMELVLEKAAAVWDERYGETAG